MTVLLTIPATVRPIALTVAIACIVAPHASRVAAHVVMGARSLHLRVAESDLVARARVTDPRAAFVSTDGKTRRQLIEIRVLEQLKGKAGGEVIRFAQDGHEEAQYRVGDEALFFLTPIAESRELRALAVPGGPTHVSSQEHDEAFLIDAPAGDVMLSATHDLVASESAATPDERVALVRRATLDLLTSGDAQLGAMALASLVLTPHAELVTPADLPRLEKLLRDSTVSIGLRAGLLAELERRALLDGPSEWLALLQNASPSELPAAIRAAGQHPSGAIRDFLIALLNDPETPTAIAAESAIALGAARNAAVVPALSAALERSEPRLRNAAIRGLGQIGDDAARSALAGAARTHADAATRRRAAAELRSMATRRARMGAPTPE